MKKSIGLFILLGVLLFSCTSHEDDSYEDTKSYMVEGKVAYDTVKKKLLIKDTEKDSKSLSSKIEDTLNYTKLKYSFVCDQSMPKFKTQKEFELFIVENPNKTNGVFDFYIDDELMYSVKIRNGQKDKVLFLYSFTETAKQYPCTYPGIKACAIDRIHNQNWYDMALCIAEGLHCVIHNYASCAIDNC